MPTARCACGAHHLELPGPPPRVTICFCDACRRRSGGPFSLNTYYAAEDLDLPGLPARRRIADSGRWLDDHFCPDCGTVLYYRFERRPDAVGVPLGLVAGFEGTPPDRAVWCRQKPAWLVLPDGVDAYVEGSDGPRWP